MYPLCTDPIGFSQKLVTVRENEDTVQITIFSYSSLDDLILNFATLGENATEGDVNWQHICICIHKLNFFGNCYSGHELRLIFTENLIVKTNMHKT